MILIHVVKGSLVKVKVEGDLVMTARVPVLSEPSHGQQDAQ